MPAILAKKLKMSQIWEGDKVIPVTVLQVAPVKIALVRTKERDGYAAAQLSLGKHRREFPLEDGQEAGGEVNVSVFAPGDLLKVSGNSKGRGFQGVVKRHGFGGGPKTHGQKNRFRAPGSIGSTAFQRVVPGRKMAGHMGNERVSVKNLLVVAVDPEKNQLLVRGAVPGHRGTLLEVMKIGAKKAK
ncbi:MAG: 50S ribosomal protein L3 [Parcubacteria group bacterium GW2011_GWA1_59_11]|nr:MAG: 50S ribosomal protein L3 [Parcubacteria group bacterium GW2011_GWA1_59_11]